MPATTRGEQKRDKTTAFRFTRAEFDEILARAQRREMTMTEYVTKAALGQLDADPLEFVRRQDEFDERLSRLERLAELGG